MSKQTVKVTENEMAAILYDLKLVKGMPIFATLVQATVAKLNAKSRIDASHKNTYGEILKVSKVSVILNSEYVKAVTNQLQREGTDETAYIAGKNTMPLTFGENNQIIGLNEKNGQLVIQYRPNDNVKPTVKYVDVANNTVIDKAELVNFLPVPPKATNQGTEREIFWRKVYLSNVLKLTLNGIEYKIIR